VLQDARETAEIWHWRAMTYQIEHAPDRPQLISGKADGEFVRAAAIKAQGGSRFLAIDGDFPVFGKPYREATEQEFRLLLSIARERHHALNWLTDLDEDWDEVLTDT